MSLNENAKYKSIDDYIDGNMSAQDLDKFKAFLQSDRDLELDTQIMQELPVSHAFNKQADTLRATLQGIKAEDIGASASTATSRQLYKWVAIGVGLLLIGASAFYTLQPSTTTNHNQLYQQYALAEPLNLITKSDASQDLIRDLESAYNANDYNEALPLIEKYLHNKPNDIDVLLAKGKAQTENKNYKGAIFTYDYIAKLNPRVKKYLWYKALAYLSQDQSAKAEEILTKIVAQQTYKYKQAEKLLLSLR